MDEVTALPVTDERFEDIRIAVWMEAEELVAAHEHTLTIELATQTAAIGAFNYLVGTVGWEAAKDSLAELTEWFREQHKR